MVVEKKELCPITKVPSKSKTGEHHPCPDPGHVYDGGCCVDCCAACQADCKTAEELAQQ